NNYVKQPQIASTTVAKLYTKLLKDDLDEFFNLLKTFLGTVPYTENTQYEGHYQSLFYVIFSLLGQYVDIEIRTPQGRVDMVLRTATRLYLIEFKIDASSEKALQQIDLKQYPERFALAGLPLTKVGVNFSSETKNIESWEITNK
ncbi:PD-(D/E)XK nuclease domain-containing protein, partial [Prevotella ihumii]|uniref:PD-(D/E)XK nuclease domain-containing protein n=1 Tax=Prevotella ihumii TaxID=1917878 RepID=UPI001F168EF1